MDAAHAVRRNDPAPIGDIPTSATGAAPLLAVRHVTRKFGGVTAIDDVSLTIERGEIAGVIGPNGAGKTTLFNVISGFTAPTRGEVVFKGTPIVGRGTHRIARLGIGRTFQNLRVFPNMTVFDNVSVGAIGRIGFPPWRALAAAAGRHAEREIARLTSDALDRVGLGAAADELAANLPYGRRKYLEIARALATRPDLLILDEPAAGLNETETQELARFIGTLNRDGITVLLVEHDMPLVMSVCRRVIVLAAGRKIADAAPAQVQADIGVRQAYLGVDA